ncbi:hypothetical protein EYW49_16605 [Siculibacillus lacustris]|uniref:Uncharacterized protein n=1 Tax=Siculibacillus lacustris TaxID=1549641 RepID=A0A4Q9VJN8_9HYPH|nr:hypothetical protein [Siculibacillus lacustris]TBW35070.1 hypothetical protein EYW49_16605 [Siculibacillus lacustris]
MKEVSSGYLQKQYRLSRSDVMRISKDNPWAHASNGCYDEDQFVTAMGEYKSRVQSTSTGAMKNSAAGKPSGAKRGRPAGGGIARSPADSANLGADATFAPGAEGHSVAEQAARVRLDRARSEARRSELKADAEAGLLVERAAVRTIVVRILSEGRARLQAIPGRLAPTLVGLTAAEIDTAIRAEIVAALADLARIEEAI